MTHNPDDAPRNGSTRLDLDETENGRQANRIADAVESGMVGVNTARLAYPDAPFQGVKQSGHGSEDGIEGLEACLVTKTIHIV